MSQTATRDQVESNPEQPIHIETPATTENLRQIGAETKNALLVVAALVMTATYQAVLQPPGGLWQDDDSDGSASTDTNSDDHTAGKSIMGTKTMPTYVVFLFFNSMGFFGSYQVIWALLEGFPLRRELRLTLFALLVTYDVSMAALTPNTALNWIFVGISILMALLFTMIVKLANCVDKLRRK